MLASTTSKPANRGSTLVGRCARVVIEDTATIAAISSDSFLIDSSDRKVTATSAQIVRQPPIEVNGIGKPAVWRESSPVLLLLVPDVQESAIARGRHAAAAFSGRPVERGAHFDLALHAEA